MKRTAWAAAAVAVPAAGLAAVAAAPATLPLSVVVLSVDGLRPDHVLEANRRGLHLPNLRRFVLEGTHATGVAGVVPTVTLPSHTTQVTGASPAAHGIVDNVPRDAADGVAWCAEDIRVPTLWDAAAERGWVTSSVEWPATAGARITFNIPAPWRTGTPGDQKVQRLMATPGLLSEAEAAVGTYPPGGDWTVATDVRRAAFNRYLIETRKPRLHLGYFSGLDDEEHYSGPFSPKALAALERIDGLIGELRAAAERNGPAVVAVVSDHGFQHTHRELNLDEALRGAGLIVADAHGAIRSWRARTWSAGGSAAVVLKDPADTEARRAARRLLYGLLADPGSGVRRVLEDEELRATGGFPGAAFVVGLKRGYRIGHSLGVPVARAGEAHGTHGMLPDDTEMDASFFVAGPGIPAGRSLGRIDMRDVAPTLAARLGLRLPRSEGRDLLAAR